MRSWDSLIMIAYDNFAISLDPAKLFAHIIVNKPTSFGDNMYLINSTLNIS